jgi:2,4-dienoyl-CoA reductase-like NADH-dependent reductase (Old Yellow Enzyme family)/thioredoxin reductase
MSCEHLFAPLDVGPMTVANRIVMAPMERNYANPDGTVSERTIAHYRLRAAGGVGWVDVESTFVDPAGRGRTHQLGLHDERCVDGMRALADAVHAGGARIGIELHHAGRNTCAAISGYEPVAPSPVPCAEAGGDVPQELTVPEIDAIIERYAAAAVRAAAAGFDAVELHSAHGYLPLAFLSPLTNLRTDEYGGSLENRMRFAVRVIEAMRAAVGPGLAVGCRFSADELLPGGLTLDETTRYAQALEAAGVDYLSVSAGVYASFVNIIPPMDYAPGWLLPTAAAIKRAVTVPVIGASRITDPETAERAIADGEVDLVAFGRALLTDPELPRKARQGRPGEIVSCIGCNQGCEARISRQRDVTCLVNPEVGREGAFALTRTRAPKRVVVIGGGPAGMEAARVCAQRGHTVTLHDRGPRLGGMINLAEALPERGGWRTFVEQAQRRVYDSGVDVRLNSEVDATSLTWSGADAIVLATGARFTRPDRGYNRASVLTLTPSELLASTPARSGRVVVSGAGAIGLGVAAWLVDRGVDVTVTSGEVEIGDPEGQGGLVARLVATGHVSLEGDTEVGEVGDGQVTLVRSGAIGPLFERVVTGVSAVVHAAGREPRRELSVHVHNVLAGTPVHLIGDCRAPRSALEAVYEGATVARRI